MSRMQERIVKVISKPPDERKAHEIDILLPWLRKRSDILKEIDNGVLMEIMRNCQCVQQKKDDVIIKQGETGDSFYMILNGTVSVFVDFNFTPPDPEDDLKDKDDEYDQKSRDEPLDRGSYGKCVVTMNQVGKCFGEIALISEDSIRTASIIVDEDSYFLVIHRNLYNKTLKAFHQRDYAERRQFVENHPLFSSWARKQQVHIQRSLMREHFSMDCPVLKQGEAWKGLTFITSGRVKVLVEPGKHIRQYPEKYPLVTKNDLFELEHLRPLNSKRSANREKSNEEMRRAALSENNHIENEHVHVKRHEGYVAAERRMLNRSIVQCLVEQGGIFGDMEIICGMKTYMNSVMTISPTTIFAISAANVERLIAKKNPRTMASLKTGVISKLYNRSTSVQGTHVPILKHLLFKLTAEEKPKPRVTPSLKVTKSLPDADVLFQHLIESFKENRTELIEPLLPGTVYYKRLMQEKLRLRDNKKKHETKKKNDNVQSSMPWSRAGGHKVTRSASVSSIQQMYERIADENSARKAMLENIMAKRESKLKMMELKAAEKAKRKEEQKQETEEQSLPTDSPRKSEVSSGIGTMSSDQEKYLILIQNAEKPLPIRLHKVSREDSALSMMSTDMDHEVFMTECKRERNISVSAPADRSENMNEEDDDDVFKSNSTENFDALAPYKEGKSDKQKEALKPSAINSVSKDLEKMQRIKVKKNGWVDSDVNNNVSNNSQLSSAKNLRTQEGDETGARNGRSDQIKQNKKDSGLPKIQNNGVRNEDKEGSVQSTIAHKAESVNPEESRRDTRMPLVTEEVSINNSKDKKTLSNNHKESSSFQRGAQNRKSFSNKSTSPNKDNSINHRGSIDSNQSEVSHNSTGQNHTNAKSRANSLLERTTSQKRLKSSSSVKTERSGRGTPVEKKALPTIEKKLFSHRRPLSQPASRKPASE